jgi:predicted Zn-dependent protease with MMP-like domain
MNMERNQWRELAVEEIGRTLEELPAPLRERAQRLAVTFELAPSADMQADGIEHDTLGIFTGSEFVEEGQTVMPPQIILFLGNLWDMVGGDEKAFREEIRVTFLHELGHYFGLDEGELAERGLE